MAGGRALSLLAAILLAASPVSAGEAEYLARQGDAMLKRGKARSALAEYTKASKMDPKSPEILAKRGTCHLVLHKMQKAVDDFDAAIALYGSEPVPIKVHLSRARCLKAMGDFDGAVAGLDDALKVDASNARAQKERAKTEEARSNKAQAMEFFEQGAALEQQGDPQGAEGYFQNAKASLELVLAEAPDDSALLLMLCKVLLASGDGHEAIAKTGQLLKLRPDSLDGYLMRGQAYLRLGDTDVAMRHFKEGYKSDSSHKGLKKEYKRLKAYQKLVKKATAKESGGDWGGAFGVYNDALVLMHGEGGGDTMLDAATRAIRLKTCNMLRQSGRGAETVACANRVLETEAGEAGTWEALVERAEGHLLQQEWDQAVHDYEQAHEAAPGHEAAEGLENARKMLYKSKQKDFYGVLGIENTADDRQIKKAYRKLAMQWHPDKHQGVSAEEAKEVEKKFVEIAEAYEILSNEEKKGRFDRGEPVDPEKEGGGDPFANANQQFHFHFG